MPSSGFVLHVNSSVLTGSGRDSYHSYSHLQITTSRSRNAKQTCAGEQVARLRSALGYFPIYGSCLASAIASEDCHSRRNAICCFHFWGFWNEYPLDSSTSQTASDWKAQRTCILWKCHSPPVNAMGQHQRRISWRHEFPGVRRHHLYLVFLLATNWDSITYCGCSWFCSQKKRNFYLVSCSSNTCVYGDYFWVGMPFLFFPTTLSTFQSLGHH